MARRSDQLVVHRNAKKLQAVLKSRLYACKAFSSIRGTAASLWNHNGKSREETQQLLGELNQYKLGSRPFLGSMADSGLESLLNYWNSIQFSAAASGAPLQLPALAVRIHDIKPHAADPEKTFSLMSFFHTSRRNQLRSETTTAMTAIKMHYTRKDPVRKAKPVREIEAILKKEEDLQRLEELANAEEVAKEVAQDIEKDPCDIRAASSMDLCSTKELMSVFTEFYDGDMQDMAKSHVNRACTEASVDVSATEFDLGFAGNVAQVSMPDMDYGDDDGGWDVDALLQAVV